MWFLNFALKSRTPSRARCMCLWSVWGWDGDLCGASRDMTYPFPPLKHAGFYLSLHSSLWNNGSLKPPTLQGAVNKAGPLFGCEHMRFAVPWCSKKFNSSKLYPEKSTNVQLSPCQWGSVGLLRSAGAAACRRNSSLSCYQTGCSDACLQQLNTPVSLSHGSFQS